MAAFHRLGHFHAVTYCGVRLVANAGQSFQGTNVLGKGFILTPEQADKLLQSDPRNKDVLFPYLNGEDLNSRPDCSASRWVINFHDWPEERARSYPEVFNIIERDVKPERLKNNRKVYRDNWWQYAEKRPAMLKAVGALDRVLVVARVSRTAAPTMVSTGQVLNEKIVVFATDRLENLSLLNSTAHYLWAWRHSSTLKTDLQYTPSDCFETFAAPVAYSALRELGQRLMSARQAIMDERHIGLTKLYREYHSTIFPDPDIRRLRGIHQDIDVAVAHAYGWDDLDMIHRATPTQQGDRYSVASSVQSEILDRLLELNRERSALKQVRSSPSLPAGATGVTSVQQDSLFYLK